MIISQEHRKAAKQVYGLISGPVRQSHGKFIITIAGESGAGKSEIAAALAEELENKGLPVLIIQQDDFFVYPPRTNAAMRIKSGGKVGPEEVRLDKLNKLVDEIKEGRQEISKPLVIFTEDRITRERIRTSPYRVIVIEGTYTTLLKDIDCRVFIDRDLEDTRADRLKRNREKQDDFLEKILIREHEIISAHKPMADIMITREFKALENKNG